MSQPVEPETVVQARIEVEGRVVPVELRIHVAGGQVAIVPTAGPVYWLFVADGDGLASGLLHSLTAASVQHRTHAA
jgi:hypothetical protein